MTIRPAVGSTHDIVLADNKDASGEAVGLMVLRPGEDNPLAMRRVSHPQRPVELLRLKMDSWHRGFGDYLYNPEDPYRYAYSDGLDARFPNRIQFAPRIETLTLPTAQTAGSATLPNGDFASSSLSAWRTFQQPLGRRYYEKRFHDDPRRRVEPQVIPRLERKDDDGNNYLEAGLPNSRADTLYTSYIRYMKGGVQYRLGSLTDLGMTAGGSFHLAFRYRTVYGTAYARIVRLPSSDTGAPVEITATRPEGALPTSADWTSTVVSSSNIPRDADNSDVLWLVLDLYVSYGEWEGFGAYTYGYGRRGTLVDLDDFQQAEPGEAAKTIVQYKNEIYVGFGNALLKINEASLGYDQIRNFTTTSAAIITDLCVHGKYLVVAVATAADDGEYWTWDGTTWRRVALTYRPDFIESVLDHAKQNRLVIGTQPNILRYSTSDDISVPPPADQQITVGHSASKMTRIYKALDSTLIGKTDGLYYPRVNHGENWAPSNVFAPAAFSLVESDVNYIAGAEHPDGWFYYASQSFGLERMRFGQQGRAVIENVNPGFSAPQYSQYGGRIVGLASDGYYMYALQLESDRLNILSGSHEATSDGRNLVWHTLGSIPYRPPFRGLFYDVDQGLYMLSGDVLSLSILHLPKGSRNPLNDDHIHMGRSGSLVTPIIDFGDQGWGIEQKRFSEIFYRLIGDADSTWTFGLGFQLDESIKDEISWNELPTVHSESDAVVTPEPAEPAPDPVAAANAVDFVLAAQNVNAEGIAATSTRLYVLDRGRRKVFTYDYGGNWIEAEDWNLHSSNTTAYGIAVTNDRFYVVDAGGKKVYVYDRSGARQSGEEFNLRSSTGFAQGIFLTADRIYVADYTRTGIDAYNRVSKAFVSADSIATHAINQSASGVYVTATRIFVLDPTDNFVYIYDHNGGYHNGFSLRTGNARGSGMTVHADKLFVCNRAGSSASTIHRMVYVYSNALITGTAPSGPTAQPAAAQQPLLPRGAEVVREGFIKFPDHSVGRSIRLRPIYTAGTNKSNLRVETLELTAMPIPRQRYVWDITAQIGAVRMINGQQDTRPPAEVINAITEIAKGGTAWLFYEKGAPAVEVVVSSDLVEWRQDFLPTESEQEEVERRRFARLQLAEVQLGG